MCTVEPGYALDVSVRRLPNSDRREVIVFANGVPVARAVLPTPPERVTRSCFPASEVLRWAMEKFRKETHRFAPLNGAPRHFAPYLCGEVECMVA